LCKSGAFRYHDFKSHNGSIVKVVLREDVVKYGEYLQMKRVMKLRKS